MLTHASATGTSASPVAEKPTRKGRGWRIFVTVLLSLSVLLTFGYTATSIYMAYTLTQLSLTHRMPIDTTPASLGLQYKDVTFPSRYDHLQLKGWFIPGILSNGHLTAQRAIIMVHGDISNRVDKGVGILSLSGNLARQGFAVLTFDMRGNGESPAAPRSLGQYEQRDVMGAVDFLQSGSLPYPELGRPRAIVGWGESMGGATLILAAANEPAIRAIVSDSAYADVLPRIERDVPAQGHLPPMFHSGRTGSSSSALRCGLLQYSPC